MGKPGENQYKIKKFIDDIYQKEMKYRYHKQYVRDDYLLTKSAIFNLNHSHILKPRRDIVLQNTTATSDKEEEMDAYGRLLLERELQQMANFIGF